MPRNLEDGSVSGLIGAGAPADARRARRRDRYGPWAVVTGASDDIGEQMVRGLAAEGLNVVLVARRGPVLEDVAASVSGRHGVATRVVSLDLGERDAPERLDLATRDLDVGLLVAAAGFGTSGALVDGPLEPELDMIDVNCRAVLGLSHTFAQRFRRRGRGGLVLFSSVVAWQGVPYAANYAATKAYVQSLAEGLSVELAPFGVDVLAPAPGPVQSGFAQRANMRMGATVEARTVAQETLRALGRRVTIVPGRLSKVLTYSLLPLPRAMRIRIMTQVMRGMTKHRDKTSEIRTPQSARGLRP